VEQVSVRQQGAFIRLEWEAPRQTDHGSPKVELKEANVLRRVVEPPPPPPEAEPELEAPDPDFVGPPAPPAPPAEGEPKLKEPDPDFVGPPAPPRPPPPAAPPPRPPSFPEEATVIATLEVPSEGGPVSFRDPWDPSWEGKRVEYAVRHRNRKGRDSALSAVAGIEPVPPLSAPTDLKAAAADGFVSVSWREEPPGPYGFDLYRRSEPAPFPPAPLNSAPLAVARYEDRTAPWGSPVCYQLKKVAVLSKPEGVPKVEGEPPAPLAPAKETVLVRTPTVIESPVSAEACLTPLDTFAPPAPQSVVAVTAAGGILISWAEVEAPDLAGYRVFRATSEKGPFEAVNETPVELATYTDRGVVAGELYFYAVSAVDRAAPPNESERSPVVSARLSPQ
jgi:hypothetical protein